MSGRPPRFRIVKLRTSSSVKAAKTSSKASSIDESRRPPHAFVTSRDFESLLEYDDDETPAPPKKRKWHPVVTSSDPAEESSSPPVELPIALRRPRRESISTRRATFMALNDSPTRSPEEDLPAKGQLNFVQPSQLDSDQFAHVSSMPRVDLVHSRRPFLGRIEDTAFKRAVAEPDQAPLGVQARALAALELNSEPGEEQVKAKPKPKESKRRTKSKPTSLKASLLDSRMNKRYPALELGPAQSSSTTRRPARSITSR
jgi:hypothetical protein